MSGHAYTLYVRFMPSLERDQVLGADGAPLTFPTWDDADQAAERQAQELQAGHVPTGRVVGHDHGMYLVEHRDGEPYAEVHVSRV